MVMPFWQSHEQISSNKRQAPGKVSIYSRQWVLENPGLSRLGWIRGNTIHGNYMTQVGHQLSFFGLQTSPVLLNWVNTSCRCPKCFSKVFKATTPIQLVSFAISINRWKMALALQSLNGIRTNSKRSWWVVKADFGLEASSSSTCQYPVARCLVSTLNKKYIRSLHWSSLNMHVTFDLYWKERPLNYASIG